MLEMTDLHVKSSFRKPKIFTNMILLAVEFSLYTNFVRGVALNAYKSSNQLETFSNRFLAKLTLHLDTRNMSIALKNTGVM
jgi:hypothetical protein